MPRRPSGQLIVREGKRDTTYGARVRVGGERRFVVLGYRSQGMTEAAARLALEDLTSDIRRGRWQPPAPEPAVDVDRDPTFHVWASEWLAKQEQRGLGERTIEDYRWALEVHLLPYFATVRLSQISKRMVDDYATRKAKEGALSANSINKTLTRLSQCLALAVEYDDLAIASNPATGKARRLKGTRPQRAHVEPEQLPSLLEAADGYLLGRGRSLVATLAGAGLRIGEALALERRDVNIARGTSPSASPRRTRASAPSTSFPRCATSSRCGSTARHSSGRQTRSFRPTGASGTIGTTSASGSCNPRSRRRTKRLAELGIEPIGNVTPHGLRRTFATLRCAVGDDVAYTADQLGHEDAGFSLRVYTHAVKRRQRLTGNERAEFERALEMGAMGTNGH